MRSMFCVAVFLVSGLVPASAQDSQVGQLLEPAWCPQKGSPDPDPSGRLRIATWNLGNLHHEDGQSTYRYPRPSVKRYPIDYLRLRCYVRLIDPDILAVQEVDGEAALERIVDTDVYHSHVSERPKPNNLRGRQNTGFAYKKGLEVKRKPDFVDLDVSNGYLRHGTRIDLTQSKQTFLLMSVHLKSGCFDNSYGKNGRDCTKLVSQVSKLEDWIDDAAAGPNPFIVLGDFNRRFNLPNDFVWSNLDDSHPPNADLTTVTEGMTINCRDNQFTQFIDHIVFDKRGIGLVDRSSFRHVTFRQEDKPVWDKISDHCPVVVEMGIP